MTQKHTPSPWLWRPKSDSVHGSSETHPYGDYLFAFQEECVPNDADLALILAAPELLEALVEAVECGMVPVSSAKEGGASAFSAQVRCADKIRAAIAKATGEA